MRLIIVGGGGFGLELYSYVCDDIDKGRLPADTSVAVADANPGCELLSRIPEATFLGDVAECALEPGDRALISVGNTSARRKLYAICEKRGIPLGTYVHSTAWVAPSARLSAGVIIGPHSVVAAFATVLENVATNVHCGIGHGSLVGRHSILGPYSVINGDTTLGESCLLGTRVTLFPRVSLGRGCVVDAHTAVRTSADDYRIISVKRQDIVLNNRLADRSTD